MERWSYFIKNKALFGSFPDQEAVNHLEGIGVRCFIDLTLRDETNTKPYKTNYKYINYPIQDRKTPKDWKSFAQLILEICRDIEKLENDEKLYIHCKGGHGRSGILVACILCYYHNLNTELALKYTAQYHSERPLLKEKWKKIGSPQGKKQKDFVHNFFRPLYYELKKNKPIFCLNNNSDHPVTIPDVGTFPSAHFAYLSFKEYINDEYIHSLMNGKYIHHFVKSDEEAENKWNENKVYYMYRVLELKFRQNPMLIDFLLNTGLRPLVKVSSNSFWGDGSSDDRKIVGKNFHGKILCRLRNIFFHEDYLNSKYN